MVDKGKARDDDVHGELICSRLGNGTKIPRLAMWDASSKCQSRDIDKCLQFGYRHIVFSSKSDYDQDIGNSLKKWIQKAKPGHGRDELFVSLVFELGPVIGLNSIQQQINHQVQKIECQHIDMLILYKGDNVKIGDNLRQQNALKTAWKAFEKLVNDSVILSLSLANFCRDEVESLMEMCTIQPQVLWLTRDPSKVGWKNLDHVRRYCLYKELVLGFMHRTDRPEAEWVRSHGLILGKVSEKHQRTPLQIFHRMLMQNGILVAVATDSKTFEKSFQVFDFCLTEDDTKELQDLRL